MTAASELIQLGKTDIQISTLGIGAWSWGDRLFWGYGRGYQDEDVRAAFDATLEAGINFIDTAETYGQGQSERLLGKFLPNASHLLKSPKRAVVATKFFPFPWRLRKNSLLGALRRSLKRLGLEQVDLYQIHWPYGPVAIETWADALAEAVQAGLTRAVGVSNYNVEQMRRAFQILEKRGIPLASNQVEYNLMHRQAEFSGLLKTCQDLGVTLIAYSPLAKGSLTGKYTPEKPPTGFRSREYNPRVQEKIQPLIRKLREIGHAREGKTPAQVALNWLICKGAVPIPGAKNARQAQDNAGAIGWRLTAEEMAILDELSATL